MDRRLTRWVCLSIAACVGAAVPGGMGASEPPPPECSSGQIRHADGCAEAPRRIRTADPKYPRKARKAHAEGCVVLLVRVAEDGTPACERVLETTNPGWGFESAAKKVVRKWKYKPATIRDEQVAVSFPVFLDFLIDSPSICNEVTELDGYP